MLAEERRIDDEAQAVGERADEVNKRLYSGTTTSPRELQAMQADIDMLHRRRSDLEDEELEVMEQRETLDAELAVLDAAIEALKETAGKLSRTIVDTEAEIDEEIARETRGTRRSRPTHRGSAAPRLRAAARAEPRCGGGPARRHDVSGVPPHDPVDGSGEDPPRGGERDRVLRQLLRDPRAVTQPSLFAEPAGTQLDEVVIYCDGGSRGNPGPSAIGAVVFDPSVDPPRVLAEVSERIGVTTNNVAEYRALIAGLEAAARFGARARARARRLEARHRAGEGPLEGEATAPRSVARRSARVARGLLRCRSAARSAGGERPRRRTGERGARRRVNV